MISAGADMDEAMRAIVLFEMLNPCLRIKANGRIDTTDGDKTILGLYRMVRRYVKPETR